MIHLRKFQRKDVKRIEKFNGRVLLASEMGLGKTAVALSYLYNHPTLRPAVIVTPACLKWVWESQASEHYNLQTVILSGRKKPKSGGLFLQNPIMIINYDILSSWIPYLKSLNPQVIIGDEVQAIKSRKAQRSKAMKELCKGVEHVLMLSGTPLVNRHAELFHVLNILWPKEFPHFFPFAHSYCAPRMTPWGWDFRRSSNSHILHSKLKELGMIRRLKKDVLKDLPSKTRIIVPIDIQNRLEYEKAKHDFINWLSMKDPAKAKRASKAQELVKLGYLIRLSSELKMKSVFEWIDNFLESEDGKLGLFMCHRKIVEMVYERYKKISVMLTGATSERGRKEAVQNFQKNDKIRIFIGNIRAAGVGIDLWAANTMAFIETGLVPADVLQCEDRFHRIGQTKNVACYYLVAKNTVEEKLCRILQQKQKVITNTLDGKLRRKQSKLDVYSQLIRLIGKGD